jgi:ubiquitin-protein ligase
MNRLRLRRLQADYEAVRRLAHLHPRIEVEGVEGNPPQRYLLRLRVRSLRERDDRVVVANEHRVEINLPLTYPRDPPLSRMLTPVFHPNIAPHAICVGDDWSAGESLDNLIQRIGEILSFQSYNTQSPLNGRAARWVEENERRLPVDTEEFYLDLSAVPTEEREAAERRCANCGTTAEAYESCPAGHELCESCQATCPTCGRLLCLVCGIAECPVCTEPACANCASERGIALVCERGHALCRDCLYTCEDCGAMLCMLCDEVSSHTCPAPEEGGESA